MLKMSTLYSYVHKVHHVNLVHNVYHFHHYLHIDLVHIFHQIQFLLPTQVMGGCGVGWCRCWMRPDLVLSFGLAVAETKLWTG